MTIRTVFAAACGLLAIASGVALMAQQPPPPQPAAPPPFGVVAYPPRPAGDPVAIDRGKASYGVNCTFCHGADLRGGDGGGPNLLRSTAVLDDQKGELIGPIITEGRGAMPKFQLSAAQIRDIAEFLHSFEVSSRYVPTAINILVGDATAGAAYVEAKCASCHTRVVLKAFATKLAGADAKVLQQMWLMPGGGGRGGGGAPPPIAAPPITATVTLPSGEVVSGTVDRIDDFIVSLVQPDGRRRTIRTAGTTAKVEIHDRLKPHKDLLRTYSDSDIHNVTAFLASLR